MANSADPDQKPADLDLHCLQSRAHPGSAWLRLRKIRGDDTQVRLHDKRHYYNSSSQEKLVHTGSYCICGQQRIRATCTSTLSGQDLNGPIIIWWIGRAKRKSAFEHAQNVRIHIILRMLNVSSGPLFSIHTLCSIPSRKHSYIILTPLNPTFI